jgi:carboxyl-terminal processing protease
MKVLKVAAALVVAYGLALSAPPVLAQGNTSVTDRQLNLVGEVFERVRADYVEDVQDR